MVSSKFPHISKSVQLLGKVTLEGDVFIQDNVVLAEDACVISQLGRLIIEEGVYIGELARVENLSELKMTIKQKVILEPKVEVYNLIGEETVIGEGAKIYGTVGKGCWVKPYEILNADTFLPDNSVLENKNIRSITNLDKSHMSTIREKLEKST